MSLNSPLRREAAPQGWLEISSTCRQHPQQIRVPAANQASARDTPSYPRISFKGELSHPVSRCFGIMAGARQGSKESGKVRMWEGLREGRGKKGQTDDPCFTSTTFFSRVRLCPVGRRKESGLVFSWTSPLKDGPAAAAAAATSTAPVCRALLFYPLRSAFGTPRVLTRRSAGLAWQLPVLLIWGKIRQMRCETNNR